MILYTVQAESERGCSAVRHGHIRFTAQGDETNGSQVRKIGGPGAPRHRSARLSRASLPPITSTDLVSGRLAIYLGVGRTTEEAARAPVANRDWRADPATHRRSARELLRSAWDCYRGSPCEGTSGRGMTGATLSKGRGSSSMTMAVRTRGRRSVSYPRCGQGWDGEGGAFFGGRDGAQDDVAARSEAGPPREGPGAQARGGVRRWPARSRRAESALGTAAARGDRPAAGLATVLGGPAAHVGTAAVVGDRGRA